MARPSGGVAPLPWRVCVAASAVLWQASAAPACPSGLCATATSECGPCARRLLETVNTPPPTGLIVDHSPPITDMRTVVDRPPPSGPPTMPPTHASETREIVGGDGQHCPEGQYRVQGIVWECGQTKNSGLFQLPAGTTQTAITMPVGLTDFGFKTTSSSEVFLAVVDMATQVTPLRGGSRQYMSKVYQGVTIAYSQTKLDGMHVASLWVEGTLRSELTIRVISKDASDPTVQVKMDYLYTSINPCPETVNGCGVYDPSLAQEAMRRWSCAARRTTGAQGDVAAETWDAFTAGANVEAPGSRQVPWYKWPAVWAKAGEGVAGEDWKLAFAFVDKDRSSMVSASEFEAGFNLCDAASALAGAGGGSAPPLQPAAAQHLGRPAEEGSSRSFSAVQALLGVAVFAIAFGIAWWYKRGNGKGRQQRVAERSVGDPFITQPRMTPRMSDQHSKSNGHTRLPLERAAYLEAAPPVPMEKRPAHNPTYAPIPLQETEQSPTVTAHLSPPAAPPKDEGRHCGGSSWDGIMSCVGWRGGASDKHAWNCAACDHRMLVQTTSCSKCGALRNQAPRPAEREPPRHAAAGIDHHREREVHIAPAEHKVPAAHPVDDPDPFLREEAGGHMEHQPIAQSHHVPNDSHHTAPAAHHSTHDPVAEHFQPHHQQPEHHPVVEHVQHHPEPEDAQTHHHPEPEHAQPHHHPEPEHAQPHHHPEPAHAHETHHHAPEHQQHHPEVDQQQPQAQESSVEGVIHDMQQNSYDIPGLIKGCTYLSEIARDAGGQDEAMRCGADDAVMKAMEMHPDSLELQLEACPALRNFVLEREDFADRISERHGVEIVLRVMRVHIQCPELVEKACWVLQQLSLSEAGRRSIASDSGTALIVEGMRSHTALAGVQESGSLTIGNLAFDEPLRQQIASSSSVAAIVQGMLAHEFDVGVQEAGVFALHNIACSQDLVGQIAAANGKATLEKAVKNHPDIEEREEAQATIDMLEYWEQVGVSEQQ